MNKTFVFLAVVAMIMGVAVGAVVKQQFVVAQKAKTVPHNQITTTTVPDSDETTTTESNEVTVTEPSQSTTTSSEDSDESDETTTPDIDVTTTKAPSMLCSFCIHFVQEVEEIIDSEEGTLEEEAEKICDKFTTHDDTLNFACHAMVKNFLENIVNALKNFEPPQKICTSVVPACRRMKKIH